MLPRQAIVAVMKVGFIGVGTMGASMASNLQRGGYHLVVNDVTREHHVGEHHGEHHVPMRAANLALDELTEALNRGWGGRDSRAAMLLQEERAGVEIQVDPARLREARDQSA